MTGPDYIVIGAMKCGTSTLAAQLGGQKGVFMTTPKEPNYFSDDANYAKGADWYQSLFAPAQSGDLLGEASTHYTKRPDYPDTIARIQAQVGTDLRLVYMIRNPMHRLVSHYIHSWSEAETSLPLDATLAQNSRLVDYGRYGWQIAPFIEAFGRNSVLLTSLERLRQDQDAELARIALHIGHKGPVAWNDPLGAQNTSAKRSRKLPMHSLIVDHPVSTALRRMLVPKALRTYVRESRQVKKRPEIPDAARADLVRQFLEDRDVLAEFFPGDPSLHLAYPFAP
ncbi:sulfotransferase domain-containing protein [Octadecabacter sp. 1_MG-2023]|uniref:sulfotransferase domain-containing protein n=1 Tax=unclassified Octadecabacter TaxID=196158 RepID=UPI001C082250|nr:MULTISPECIES: sulfotransferase domain-containing protein [unclassified Octadecabacter]MBU2994048.1 sulfotransferase domain-containing protein [Octadecabacter sp. B2R22]MDO6736098.1 sulfotransferase domain-containing protein [Octadecabacter sp. 1_MG-2023]